ncbi:MAG: zinc ABC transporter substrate-binding protein [Thermoguttaceae bacterium]|nr:zinc ABC transporter substrate-binding protein [Thermoguttaceae bacterium]
MPITRRSFLISLVPSFLAAGCAKIEPSGEARVLAPVEPVSFFLRELAGGAVQVETLVPAGQEPETFAPTVPQLARAAASRVLFQIGFPLEEALLERLRSSAGRSTGRIEVVDLRPEKAENSDPHIWMSPAIMKKALAPMAEALTKLAPEAAEEISRRAADLTERLTALEEEITAAVEASPTRELYVFHPAYGYFCRQFGLEQIAFECHGHDPSPREMADWIRRVKERDVRVIIAQPEFSQTQIRSVAEQTGVPVRVHSPLEGDYFKNLRGLTALIAGGPDTSGE